jgi:hypothetical protein
VNYATQVSVGLDTRDALPKDSYLVEYLDSRDKYAIVGPELSLVFGKDVDYSNETFQNLIASIVGANANSVENLYAGAPLIVAPVRSWLDDYLSFGKSSLILKIKLTF